ncbi:protein SSUH2 homolog [Pocillopora damicornis]|uniref:protein SSUH2 homolog n=1 Tax=Pocillopora damicornis TaxID=46731 RepID=UPI000F553377|nr:protein SSUH2 homolog [Pocillopora damicornis]
MASGYKLCYECHGRGRVCCTSCNGSGNSTEYRDGQSRSVSCTWCCGSGTRTCDTCHGHGHVICWICLGQTQLKWFIQLTITW